MSSVACSVEGDDARRQLARHAVGDVARHRRVDARALVGVLHLGRSARRAPDARLEVRDRRRHVVAEPARAQQPGRAAPEAARWCGSASATGPRRAPGCPAPRSPATAARGRRSRGSSGRRGRPRARAPVVSTSRCVKVLPTRLIMLLVTCVAMISRLSGWRGISSPRSALQRLRGSARAPSRPTGRRAAATRAARRRAISCCRRGARRARLVSRGPCARRSAITRSDGRNSMPRFSRPAFSRKCMKRACASSSLCRDALGDRKYLGLEHVVAQHRARRPRRSSSAAARSLLLGHPPSAIGMPSRI